MSTKESQEKEFSFRDYFVPLTTLKVVHFIIFIGFIVFGNALLNEFVWDDLLITQIKPLSGFDFFGQNLLNLGGQYRPLTILYFSLINTFFGNSPFYYHLFVIITHIVNTLLVFFLFKRYFSLTFSFFLSLLFLVHPMQVESAVYAATGGNTFFITAGLLAMLISQKERISIIRAVLISLLLLLSLLAKETGILFIVMVILFQVFYKRKNLRAILFASSVAIIIYSFLRFAVAKILLVPHSSIVPIAALGINERILNIPAMFLYYVKTFFFPKELVIMQFWTVASIDSTYILTLIMTSLIIICIFSFALIFFKKNKKSFYKYLYFVMWFFAGVLFHMQLFPLDMTVADRWFYFPLIGLLGMIGVVLQFIFLKFNSRKYANKFFLLAGITILLLLSMRTMMRTMDWRDSLTLFTRDSQIKSNFMLENNLGWSYKDMGDLHSALIHFRRSVNLYEYDTNLFNTGSTYVELGRTQEAREYFFKILESNKYQADSYSRALSLTASMLVRYDSVDVSKTFIKKALQKDPDNGSLWASLAIAEYKAGNKEIALQHSAKAKDLYPRNGINYLYSLILNNKPIPENINTL